MFVKTFIGYDADALDANINAFMESWSKDSKNSYKLVDIKFGQHKDRLAAMMIYNKEDASVEDAERLANELWDEHQMKGKRKHIFSRKSTKR